MSAYRQSPAAQGCACSADITQIKIGGFIVGIAGLRGIFNTFHSAGREPDAALADELLAMVKVYNYVAPNSEDEYKAALLREYTRYWNARLPRDGSSTSVSATRQTSPQESGPIASIIGSLRKLLKRTSAASGVHR